MNPAHSGPNQNQQQPCHGGPYQHNITTPPPCHFQGNMGGPVGQFHGNIGMPQGSGQRHPMGQPCGNFQRNESMFPPRPGFPSNVRGPSGPFQGQIAGLAQQNMQMGNTFRPDFHVNAPPFPSQNNMPAPVGTRFPNLSVPPPNNIPPDMGPNIRGPVMNMMQCGPNLGPPYPDNNATNSPCPNNNVYDIMENNMNPMNTANYRPNFNQQGAMTNMSQPSNMGSYGMDSCLPMSNNDRNPPIREHRPREYSSSQEDVGMRHRSRSREQNVSPYRKDRLSSPHREERLSYRDRRQHRKRSPPKRDESSSWRSKRESESRSFVPARKELPSERRPSGYRRDLPDRTSSRNDSNKQHKRRISKRDRRTSKSPTRVSSDINEKNSQEENESQETKPDDPPIPSWVRSAPADVYFRRNKQTQNIEATQRMIDLMDRFDKELVSRASRTREMKPKYKIPPRQQRIHMCTHSHGHESSSCSSSDSDDDEQDHWMEELNRKKAHPDRLHSELWFNEKAEMNDGPLCRCSRKAQRSGIRHDIYPGEEPPTKCDPNSNNADKLYHYRITMSPHTNFLTKNPTTIEYDNHEYIFEGLSLFTHYKIKTVPVCKLVRFNIEYTIHWFEEDIPESFCIRSVDQFCDFLFTELLELLDLDWLRSEEGFCRKMHLMPRFARDLPDNGKELLCMNEVLQYLLTNSKPVIETQKLAEYLKYEKHEWQSVVDSVRGMIVTNPGMRPAAIRVDQLDRQQDDEDVINYPLIIHFGIRPAQLSYAGDPKYLKLWKQFVKFRHLLVNKPKITTDDREKLIQKEEELQEMRLKASSKREVTVEISSENFIRTGINCDICQHALLAPVFIQHLRFHQCLEQLETRINYQFKERKLLQYALTHPSYRVNYGTNPDHARNSVTNCGVRQPEYGDRSIHFAKTRKRGINQLIHIMAKLGKSSVTESQINHYERLEYLGDAVVEFLTSIHLYYMFPNLEEGGLATYRAALVQNQHLAILAGKLQLDAFMLYAHGPDLCHMAELKHAMANCFESLLGALLLDGGMDAADMVLANTLFDPDDDLRKVWTDTYLHPLQADEPEGDRDWIRNSPQLQKLKKFEETTGIEFQHIRLLAKAFTLRNVHLNQLTLGHNQRMEFLGDTILQLVSSEYLYNHFPEHHEGHLSLLRSSIVSNKTQAVICGDLGMEEYVIQEEPKRGRGLYQYVLKLKDKADLLEAFMGALFVDKGLEYCKAFCNVCFFPRLHEFIVNQEWNDPKSRLQQCCLTLRDLDSSEPDTPIYKVLEAAGPTNTRKFKVAVYFRGRRLAKGLGASIQSAEMEAATNALVQKYYLFPQLSYQKHFIRAIHKLDSETSRKSGKRKRESDNPKAYRDIEEDEPDKKHSKRDEIPKAYKEEQTPEKPKTAAEKTSPKCNKRKSQTTQDKQRPQRSGKDHDWPKRTQDRRSSRTRDTDTNRSDRLSYDAARRRGRPILGRREERNDSSQDQRERSRTRETRGTRDRSVNRVPADQGREQTKHI